MVIRKSRWTAATTAFAFGTLFVSSGQANTSQAPIHSELDHKPFSSPDRKLNIQIKPSGVFAGVLLGGGIGSVELSVEGGIPGVLEFVSLGAGGGLYSFQLPELLGSSTYQVSGHTLGFHLKTHLSGKRFQSGITLSPYLNYHRPTFRRVEILGPLRATSAEWMALDMLSVGGVIAYEHFFANGFNFSAGLGVVHLMAPSGEITAGHSGTGETRVVQLDDHSRTTLIQEVPSVLPALELAVGYSF